MTCFFLFKKTDKGKDEVNIEANLNSNSQLNITADECGVFHFMTYAGFSFLQRTDFQEEMGKYEKSYIPSGQNDAFFQFFCYSLVFVRFLPSVLFLLFLRILKSHSCRLFTSLETSFSAFLFLFFIQTINETTANISNLRKHSSIYAGTNNLKTELITCISAGPQKRVRYLPFYWTSKGS